MSGGSSVDGGGAKRAWSSSIIGASSIFVVSGRCLRDEGVELVAVMVMSGEDATADATRREHPEINQSKAE